MGQISSRTISREQFGGAIPMCAFDVGKHTNMVIMFYEPPDGFECDIKYDPQEENKNSFI